MYFTFLNCILKQKQILFEIDVIWIETLGIKVTSNLLVPAYTTLYLLILPYTFLYCVLIQKQFLLQIDVTWIEILSVKITINLFVSAYTALYLVTLHIDTKTKTL